MKKLVAVLSVAVVLLVAVLVTDFVVAPQTTMGLAKSRIGASLVANEVRQAFEKDAIEGVEKFCANPVQKLGFYYTCFVTEIGQNGPDGVFRDVVAYVSTYDNEDAVRDATTGRLTWDAAEEKKLTHDAYFYSTVKATKRLTTPVATNVVTLLKVRVD